MEWFETIEDFKKLFNRAEELNQDEELESYENLYSSKGVAYTFDYAIEYRVGTTYSREKLKSVWNCVYKVKPRESSIEETDNPNFIHLRVSDIYLDATAIVAFRKRVLDGELIGGNVLLSNSRDFSITAWEYCDLKEYIVGELECLK